MNNNVEHPPQHHPSVAEQLAHPPAPAPAPQGRIFVFVPFHPVDSVDTHLSDHGSYAKIDPRLMSQDRFERRQGEVKDDDKSLASWWDNLYREGMERLHSQLTEAEQAEFARKIPEVVVMGDKWSEASKHLREATVNDTVYVVGHSDKGRSMLYSKERDWGSRTITPENLLQRMEAQGIPQQVGKVKIFACSGAADENSFVPKFVGASRGQGKYDNAQVTGYTAAVQFDTERLHELSVNLGTQERAWMYPESRVERLNGSLKEEVQISSEDMRLNRLPETVSAAMVSDAMVTEAGSLEKAHEKAGRRLENVRSSVAFALGRETELKEKLRATVLDKRSGMKVADQIGPDGSKARVRASSCAVDYAPGSTLGAARLPKAAIASGISH